MRSHLLKRKLEGGNRQNQNLNEIVTTDDGPAGEATVGLRALPMKGSDVHVAGALPYI